MLFYEKKTSLRVSDYDAEDRIKPQAILDLFQQVATLHADIIGIGFKEMLKRDIIWVTVRLKYEVVRNPEYCAEVTLRTWPHREGRVDFDRDYEILDEKGKVLIRGSSKWCVVNVKTRKILFGGEVTYGDGEYYEQKVFPEGIKKIKDFPTDGFFEYDGRTEYSDLDHNGHVNNARYCEFIQDAVRLARGREIKTFAIDFINEMKADTPFRLFYGEENGVYRVKALTGDTENFRAEFTVV